MEEEINTIRVEMARVASTLHNHHSPLPENSPNRAQLDSQVQNLDARCVKNVLTTSYPQESRNTSSRRVPLSYTPPPTSRRRFTMSTTPAQMVDVSNHVHNTLDGSCKPTRQYSMYFDESTVDYIENTKDTSSRRVPPSLLSVDASNRVHSTFDGLHKPRHQDSTHFDEVGFDCVETTKDTSLRRVPPFLPSVDASNRVHSTFDGSHKPTRRKSKCFDEVDVYYHENSPSRAQVQSLHGQCVRNALRRVPSYRHHSPTSQPVIDALNRIYNSPNTSHSLMH
jgi:hypothetical protein